MTVSKLESWLFYSLNCSARDLSSIVRVISLHTRNNLSLLIFALHSSFYVIFQSVSCFRIAALSRELCPSHVLFSLVLFVCSITAFYTSAWSTHYNSHLSCLLRQLAIQLFLYLSNADQMNDTIECTDQSDSACRTSVPIHFSTPVLFIVRYLSVFYFRPAALCTWLDP